MNNTFLCSGKAKFLMIVMFVACVVFQYISYRICAGTCTDYMSSTVPAYFGLNKLADVECYDPGPAPGAICSSTTLMYCTYGAMAIGFFLLFSIMRAGTTRKGGGV